LSIFRGAWNRNW